MVRYLCFCGLVIYVPWAKIDKARYVPCKSLYQALFPREEMA